MGYKIKKVLDCSTNTKVTEASNKDKLMVKQIMTKFKTASVQHFKAKSEIKNSG
jgi:hypothetical protein